MEVPRLASYLEQKCSDYLSSWSRCYHLLEQQRLIAFAKKTVSGFSTAIAS
jgi:uncharacterized membrane-anchored protein